MQELQSHFRGCFLPGERLAAIGLNQRKQKRGGQATAVPSLGPVIFLIPPPVLRHSGVKLRNANRRKQLEEPDVHILEALSNKELDF